MLGISDQNISDLLKSAKDLALKAKENASNQKIGEQVKEKLLSSSNEIQNILNAVLSKGGILTQDQYDRLQEQMKVAKINNLQAETLDSVKRVGLYAAGILAIFGILWFISKEK